MTDGTASRDDDGASGAATAGDDEEWDVAVTDDGVARTGRDSAASGDDDAYGGVLGAIPYAFRSSDSLLFRSYAAVGGLLAFGIAFLFGLALVVLLGSTAGVTGGTFSFSRAFFVLVGLLLVAPLLAPVLFVARRHRRGTADSRYDARMAATGYLFVLSIYVAGIVSTPADQQESVADLLGRVVLFGGTPVEVSLSLAPLSVVLVPVVEFLYALPRLAGLLPPLLAALLIWYVGRRS